MEQCGLTLERVPVHSNSELFDVLARGTFDQLLGTPEGERLDFKSEPYNLATERGVRDLVADVAAFANSRGGTIVLGVHTNKLEGAQEEVAVKVRGVGVGLVVHDQIRRLVRSHIQPLVRIDIRPYPLADVQKEVVAIDVEPQPDHEQPCLVDRVIGHGHSRVAHAVGWPIRHGADTHWEDMRRIQPLVAAGLRPLLNPVAGEEPAVRAVAEKQRELLNNQEGWGDWPRIVVQATPQHPTQLIPDFFGAFATKMGRWRGARDRGFNLGLDEGALRPIGSSLVAASERRFVAIDRTGVVTAAANGTPEMLGWAMDKTFSNRSDGVVANPYVVVEFPTELVRLVTEAIGPEVKAHRWNYRVSGERLAGPTRLYLRPAPTHYRVVSVDREPLADSFTEEVAGSGDTWRDAFEVVAAIYGVGYGCGHDDIPWAEDGTINLALLDSP